MADEPKKPNNLRILKPKKKSSAVTVRTGVNLPEIIAPALAKTKVTKAALCKFIEQIGLAYAPAMIKEFHQSLLAGVIRGDKDLMRMAGGYYGLVADKQGGITVNTLVNASANAAASADSESSVDFNAIARKLAERRIGPSVNITPIDQ